MIDAHALPDAAVCSQVVSVPAYQGLERFRPRLLFALNKKPHSQGQIAVQLSIDVEAGEPGDEVALVIGRATRKETVPADHRLERL
jgi:hypothetical protein